MSLTYSDVITASNIETLERQERILGKIERLTSSGFCPQCGAQDGMQAIDWRGVDWLEDEDIYTDKHGKMYTPCHHCNPAGATIPAGYWTAEPHAVMVWAIADRQSELDEIGDNAAEKEDWLRRYEKGQPE